MKDILATYEASRQMINFTKSEIFLSRNVKQDLQQHHLATVLGVNIYTG